MSSSYFLQQLQRRFKHLGFKIFAQIAVITLIIMGSIALFQELMASKPEPVKRTARERVWTIKTIPAERKNITPYFSLYGETIAGKTVDLRSFVGGQIIAVSPRLNAGQVVEKGEALVEIDRFDYEGALIEAGAQVKEAEASLQEIRAQIDTERSGLAFAKNQLIAKIDVIPTSGFSKFFNSFVNIFHFDIWAIITVVLMLLFVISFIKYTLEKYTSKKRLFFIIAGISLLFSLLSLSFAYQQQVNVNNTKYAIVFAKESDVRAEPKLSGEQAFVLHEGTKVQVLDSFQDWTKIKLTNGSIGWILKNDIKQL